MPNTNKKRKVDVSMNFSKLKEIERENKKDLIVDAAEKIFTDMPFDKVTMRHIAKEVGITATAIYRYFSDKQSLFAEIYARSNNRLLSKIKKIIDSSQDFSLEDVTLTIIEHYLLELEEQNLKMRTHLLIDDTLNEEVLNIVTDSFREVLVEIVKYFSRFNPNSDTRLLARMYIASLIGYLITFKNYPSNNQEEAIRQMKKFGKKLSSMFKAQIIQNGQ
jgi:AcrR family transcriptional regulator